MLAHSASSAVGTAAVVVVAAAVDGEDRLMTSLAFKVLMSLPARMGRRHSFREPRMSVGFEGSVVEPFVGVGRRAMPWRTVRMWCRASLAMSLPFSSSSDIEAGRLLSREQKSQHSVSGARDRSIYAAANGALEQDEDA